eukprot:28437-Chlamydomonas_euryale.AAC.10
MEKIVHSWGVNWTQAHERDQQRPVVLGWWACGQCGGKGMEAQPRAAPRDDGRELQTPALQGSAAASASRLAGRNQLHGHLVWLGSALSRGCGWAGANSLASDEAVACLACLIMSSMSRNWCCKNAHPSGFIASSRGSLQRHCTAQSHGVCLT